MRQKFLFVAFALLALSLGFSSCSNDDDVIDNNSIVGTWKFTVATAEVESNSERNDGLIGAYVIARATEQNEGVILTFRANGTYEVSGTADSWTGTYTFSDGVLVLDGVSHNASISSSVLTLYFDSTDEFENAELDKLIRIGITDIFTGFSVSKVIERISFARQ